MSLLRFLSPQGIASMAISLCLALLLVIQKGETRHWKKQSGQYEQLYRGEQSVFATTVANYRAAADRARAQDQANAERVAAEQRAITERTSHDFEARIAAARAAAERLHVNSEAAADPGARRSASMPGASAAPANPAQAAHQDGFSRADRLTATEQAIQLDELIKWVRQQHSVRVNGMSGQRP